MELIPSVLISIGIIFAIRKYLETPERLPWWDQFLSRAWLGIIAFFLLTLIPQLHFLGNWLGASIYLIILATVY